MAAILKFRLSAGQPPLPSESQAIHRALLSYRSTNAPSFKPHWTNAVGEALDMWGTPYRVTIVGQTHFVIRSAGKNEFFGDKDDVVYDSSNNGF